MVGTTTGALGRHPWTLPHRCTGLLDRRSLSGQASLTGRRSRLAWFYDERLEEGWLALRPHHGVARNPPAGGWPNFCWSICTQSALSTLGHGGRHAVLDSVARRSKLAATRGARFGYRNLGDLGRLAEFALSCLTAVYLHVRSMVSTFCGASVRGAQYVRRRARSARGYAPAGRARARAISAGHAAAARAHRAIAIAAAGLRPKERAPPSVHAAPGASLPRMQTGALASCV